VLDGTKERNPPRRLAARWSHTFLAHDSIAVTASLAEAVRSCRSLKAVFQDILKVSVVRRTISRPSTLELSQFSKNSFVRSIWDNQY